MEYRPLSSRLSRATQLGVHLKMLLLKYILIVVPLFKTTFTLTSRMYGFYSLSFEESLGLLQFLRMSPFYFCWVAVPLHGWPLSKSVTPGEEGSIVGKELTGLQ